MSTNRVIDPRAAERRRSILIMIAAAAVLILVALLVVWQAGVFKKPAPSQTGSTAAPTVVTDGAIRVTAAPANTTPPVVITVTEDFQCPACQQFEQLMGPSIASYHANPQVAVDYVTINMLDRASTTNYSTRAANTSMCVAEATGKDRNFAKWLEFHNLLFANQPAEGGAGLPDSKLISLAKDVGVEGIDDCVNSGQFNGWIDQNAKTAMARPGFTGTPNVRINGEVVQLANGDELQAKVNAALEAAK